MNKKSALISGITGMDASYLSEILLENDVKVYGLIRRSASPNFERIQHLLDENKIELIYGDMTDSKSLIDAVYKSRPNYVFNLAANSFVPNSWENPESVMDVNAVGLIRLLNAVRLFIRDNPSFDVRVYQASSSEMYGKVREMPQTETTPFYPRSPYGCSKVAAHHIAVNYRESYNMHISCGILFNHSSRRRGEEFVTKKIAREVARIYNDYRNSKENIDPLVLGNLDAKRDFGHAFDYMSAAFLMVNDKNPGDFVISSGETHSVRKFAGLAFRAANMKIRWNGSGLYETAIVINIDEKVLEKPFVVVKVSEEFYRPAEVDVLWGDSTKARELLGWKPKYSFNDLVKDIIEGEMEKYNTSGVLV